MESFEFTGVWWDPADPDARLAGKLSFSPARGGILELVEVTDSVAYSAISSSTRIEVLHGYVGSISQRFTLVGCQSIGDVNSIFKTPLTDGVYGQSFRFEVDLVLKGRRFYDRPEDIMFEEIRASFTHLPDWLATPLDQSALQENDASPLVIDVSTEPVDVMLNGRQISVAFDRPAIFPSDDGEIRISAEKPLTLNESLNFASTYADFLTLATSRTNSANIMVGVTGSDLVSVYYGNVGYTDRDGDYLISTEMLFTYEDVENHLGIYLSNWICNYERHRTIYEAYFLSHRYRESATRTVFLSLAQAIEAFHRSLYDTKYMKKAVYKQFMKAIKAVVDDKITCNEHRDHLKSIVGSMGNRYSFKNRILDLLDRIASYGEDKALNGIVDKVVGNDRFDFAKKVTNTRNDLTHLLDSDDNVIPEEYLHLYVWKMQMLLEVLFLMQMEFEATAIKRLLTTVSWKYWYLKRVR